LAVGSSSGQWRLTSIVRGLVSQFNNSIINKL
jgi:hypothetical protein